MKRPSGLEPWIKTTSNTKRTSRTVILDIFVVFYLTETTELKPKDSPELRDETPRYRCEITRYFINGRRLNVLYIYICIILRSRSLRKRSRAVSPVVKQEVSSGTRGVERPQRKRRIRVATGSDGSDDGETSETEKTSKAEKFLREAKKTRVESSKLPQIASAQRNVAQSSSTQPTSPAGGTPRRLGDKGVKKSPTHACDSQIQTSNEENRANGNLPLENKKLVVTGQFESISREEMENHIRRVS